MKRNFSRFAFLITIFLVNHSAHSQKRISEFTIVYNYSISSSAANANPSFTATNTYYVKAKMSRSEIVSSLASFSTIHDANNGTAVVLREVSGQKLLIRMNAEEWEDKNKRYDGLRFTNTAETKVIAGYNCIRAKAMTKDSLQINVYYTKDLIPDNKEFDPVFRNLDGLPLEYEIVKGNIQIKYNLASINLNPVPVSRFDIPKSGYREMTYEESKKLNPGGG
ncbi:MAG: hypothetical protein ACHQET_13290 [Chitinophagales bacterium]